MGCWKSNLSAENPIKARAIQGVKLKYPRASPAIYAPNPAPVLASCSRDEAKRNRGQLNDHRHPGLRYASSGLLARHHRISATFTAWFAIVAIFSRAARIFSR
jgi:hypothetical protein